MENERFVMNLKSPDRVAPSEIIIMYGMKDIKKRIAEDTDPMLAELKNVEHM